MIEIVKQLNLIVSAGQRGIAISAVFLILSGFKKLLQECRAPESSNEMASAFREFKGQFTIIETQSVLVQKLVDIIKAT